MSAVPAPEPGGQADVDRITALPIFGALLIGLGNVLRKVDDALADFGD